MSNVFAVNYDLRVKAKPDYEGLWKELKKSPNWWHYLESTWLVQTHETAHDLWLRILPHIHDRDRVLIIEVRNNSDGWLPKEAWDWINQNLPVLAA